MIDQVQLQMRQLFLVVIAVEKAQIDDGFDVLLLQQSLVFGGELLTAVQIGGNAEQIHALLHWRRPHVLRCWRFNRSNAFGLSRRAHAQCHQHTQITQIHCIHSIPLLIRCNAL